MEEKYLTGASQTPGEIDWFCELLQREGVRSYLEIGSFYGGSLWRAAHAMPVGSRVVSVDLPNIQSQDPAIPSSLAVCVKHLCAEGYDARLFVGDSTNKQIAAEVEKLGPFDACFIDANHTMSYVQHDWATYGPLARIVAFHDINWKERPYRKKKPIHVPLVWEQIRQKYRHEEIRLCERDNGIGVLWRW